MLRIWSMLAIVGLCTALTAAPLARVAVLRDVLPGIDDEIAEAVEAALAEAGAAATRLSMDQLESPEAFNASRYDCLLLVHGHNFTNAGRDNLLAFLNAGGDLILAGGRGFLAERFRGRNLTLPAFSSYEAYRLDAIASVTAYRNQHIVPEPIRIKGPFEGISAIGFSRGLAKFIPLLNAMDQYGRTRGWASGLLAHFGEYRGSNWLLFGIYNPGFYRTPGFRQTLAAALAAMQGDALTRAAERERQQRLATRIKLRTPAPDGFIRLSPDRKHLVYPDGRRFFMLGTNYHRSLDIGEWYSAKHEFEDLSFEDDFRKAREAGINCIRLGPASRFYQDAELVKECARKYGIYLLIILNWGTRRDFVENAERVARMYAGEPMVLGYDLQNEPEAANVAGLSFDGEKSPVLNFDLFGRYSVHLKQGFQGSGLDAFRMLWGKAIDPMARGSESTFPGLAGECAPDAEWRPLWDAVNSTFDLWIRKHVEAIRKYDREHLISVGYNRILECLPANSQLDFISHHVYDWPLSHERVMSNVTAMDRIARVWPNRPVTLGEFGYSNGVPMPDGRYLDFHTSAVGEMIHYLYALAKDYDGCMKWVLTDWHWDVIAKAADRGRMIQIYEAYFGLYWYDGNPLGLGRPKPISHATRFLREYLDEAGTGGTIELKRASNPIETAYVFRGKDALFIGDTRYESPEVGFVSASPANLMLKWGAGEIRIMSTSDADVTLDPSRIVPRMDPLTVNVIGNYGQLVRSAGRLRLKLLEGETVRVTSRQRSSP